MTDRVLRGLEDPRLTALGNPTGRLVRKGWLAQRDVLNSRDGDAVSEFARARRRSTAP